MADDDDDDTDISALIGIGPTSADWLRRAGIRRRGDLRKAGAAAAFMKVRALGVRPTLNLLWALEGALQGLHWTMIPPRRRDELKAAADARQDP